MTKTNSTTDKMLGIRLDPNSDNILTGNYYSSFSKIKKYAITNKIPLVAIWSNGDACNHCVMLEKLLISASFTKWFKNTGYIMWFGCSKDKTKDDKFEGTGFKWCYNNGMVSQYPFVRLYWKTGNKSIKDVDVIMTGDKLRNNKTGSDGVKAVQNKLKKIFSEYSPKLKIRTNPDWDDDQIAEFREKIKENDGHCPCQVPSDDTICMCKKFKEKKTTGLCICKLYEKYI